MSDFSNYFKDCITKNHINVSQLARQSGIHRTLLQKIMTGARMPSDESFFEKVLPYMMLSLHQQEELLNHYNIEKIGKDLYYQHMIVKSFIEHLQAISRVESPMLQMKIESTPRKDTYCIHDKYSLIQCISSALGRAKTRKNPTIYLLLQNADHSIYDFIASALYGRNDVKLIHLLCFQSADVESSKQLQFNIQLCESITPLLLCGCDYHPMCYYHSNAEDQSYYAPYPYVFLTSDVVINFRKDLSGAFIAREPSILNQFQEFFEKRQSISIPIIKQYHKPQDILMPYLQEMNNISLHDKVYSFMHEPCILPLIDIDLAMGKLHDDILSNPVVYQSLRDYLMKLKQMEHLITYFTKAGLYHFMDTGRISEIPDEMYVPLTLNERLTILKTMIEKQKEGRYHAYMIVDHFNFSRDLSISVYKENRIIFRYGIDVNGACFMLSELSFGTILVEFFQYLQTSRLVEKAENTLHFLEQLYQQYRN